MIRSKSAAVSLMMVMSSFSCARAEEASRMELVMGTLLQISVQADNKAEAEKSLEAGFAEVRRWDELLSNYKPNSEISRINREAYPESVTTSGEIVRFLVASQNLSRETSGYFDIMVEPLTRLWGLRERKLDAWPEDKIVNKTRMKADSRFLEVYDSDLSVRFMLEGSGIDTGGIGKGYAMDRALEKMRKHKINSAALNFGGEILYWPLSPSQTVSVKDPREPQKIWRSFSLAGFPSGAAAVSTSANYERSFKAEKYGKLKTVGHLINPKTGKPADNNIQSVTAVSKDAARADALSTAIFVMGLGTAERFMSEHPNDWALVLFTDGPDSSLKSKAWGNWAKEMNP